MNLFSLNWRCVLSAVQGTKRDELILKVRLRVGRSGSEQRDALCLPFPSSDLFSILELPVRVNFRNS